MNPIKTLISAHQSLSDVKESDLEFLSSEEILSFAAKINKNIKIAVHGRSDWQFRSDVGENDPYKTTDLVNPPSPGARGDQAGSVDPSINTVEEEDYSSHTPSKDKRINDLLSQNKEKYLIKMQPREDQSATKELAEQIYGKGASTDGRSIFIEIFGEDEARHVMNRNKESRKSTMEKI